MSKKRQQQIDMFGLMSGMDKDISSSLHDEIMLWVDERIESIVGNILGESVSVIKAWEYPLFDKPYDSGKKVLGFIDILVSCTGSYPVYFGIEVKTTVKLSELMRQMRFYQEIFKIRFRDGCRFIVVSPDDRYRDKLIEQGFYFVKYEPERTNQQ